MLVPTPGPEGKKKHGPAEICTVNGGKIKGKRKNLGENEEEYVVCSIKERRQKEREEYDMWDQYLQFNLMGHLLIFILGHI